MSEHRSYGDEPVLAALCEQARELAGDLNGSLRRIRVRAGEIAVEVEWQPEAAPPAPGQAPPVVEAATPAAPTRTVEPEAQPDRILVTSPMVGTFYRAPEPSAAPFVEVGDVVEAGQVIGIVEAMKLMNPVTAEHSGKIAEILVENAQPVEFGQPLVALIGT